MAESRAELDAAVEHLLAGRLAAPHDLLGPREVDGSIRIRAFHPDATEASIARVDGITSMRRLNAAGLFEASVPAGGPPGYRIRFRNREREWEQEDPYAFAPTLGELDLHLIGEGTHAQLWRVLGARVIEHQGVMGTAFAVWAPNALGVSLVSDANFWDARIWPMRVLDDSGVWELFCPGVGRGVHYKFLVTRRDGMRIFKADPLARAAELPPGTASIVEESSFRWRDGAWIRRRARAAASREPFAAYEVHLGSWRRGTGRTPAHLSRDRRAARRPLPGAGVHARRAAPDHGASLRRKLGIPGHRLLRADRPSWHARRLPQVRRRHAPQQHRRDPRLGARAFPS